MKGCVIIHMLHTKNEIKQIKIYEKKYIRLLFGLCWMVYCTSYLGRLNYSSAMMLMINDNILTASQAGFISMIYFFAYGTGQLVNGILGDKINPKWMIFTGLAGSGIANIIMGICPYFYGMAFIWGINGYFQAMIWAPIIRIFADMLDEKNKVNCCVNIVTSQLIGTLLSYILSAAVLTVFPWQGVFGAAALMLFLAAFIWNGGFSNVCRHGEKNFEDINSKTEPDTNTTQYTASLTGKNSLIFSSTIPVILIPVIIHGMLKDGVTTWVPTYINTSFEVSASFSILLTTLLPIINLSGAYIARYIYRKTNERIILSIGLFFLTATAALVFLYIGSTWHPLLSVLLLSVITASMMAINTLAVNIYPLRFQKYGRVSSISGFLNAMAYLGTAVSTYTIGLLVQKYDWHITILTWLAATILAAVICLTASKAE